MKFDAHPLNRIEVSEAQIRENMRLVQEFSRDVAIAPVLKSNAYGHGLEQVGKLLDASGAPFYCVNSLQEANRLRAVGVTTDILIMGYVDPSDLKRKEWDYIFAVFDPDYAQVISTLQKSPRVHITIETGLHREGIDLIEFPHAFEELKKLGNLHVEGMMSHLACANDPVCETTKQQLERFEDAKKQIIESGFFPQWFHFGGSLALLNTLSGSSNVVRVGKALFGIALNTTYSGNQTDVTKSEQLQGFAPVLTLKTKIAQVKHIKKGAHVSYADGFIAERDMTIGILPIGYNDGVDRRLTNKGKMKIGDTLCPMVGVVAMNLSVIDISNITDPHPGQEVIVYSSDEEDENSLDNAAKTCGTLPQDLLLHLPESLQRDLV